MPFDIAIDFGDVAVTVAARGWKEAAVTPAHVAQRKEEILAMGEEAVKLYGRTPRDIRVGFPLREGQVADERWLTEWTRSVFTQCAPNSRLRKASVVFTLSQTGGEAMARSLRAAAQACEMQEPRVIDRSLAVWLGAGEDPKSVEAGLLAYLGEGYAAASLICRGAVQCRYCVPGGLGEISRAIAEQVRREYGLSIGPVTAGELRAQLAAARGVPGVRANAVGLDLASGFPDVREIPARLGEEAALPVCDALCECLRRAAAQAAPDAAADLAEKPALLCGAGAKLPGLEARITEKTGLACKIAEGSLGDGLMRLVTDDELKALAQPL